VINTLASRLRDKAWVAALTSDTSNLQALLIRAEQLATTVEQQRHHGTDLLTVLLKRVVVEASVFRLMINTRALLDRLEQRTAWPGSPVDGEARDSDHGCPLEITIPSQLQRRGKQVRLIVNNPQLVLQPDSTLVQDILRARRWFAALSSGAAPSIASLARSDKCSASYISLKISLAFLAPDILEAILDGTQPSSLTTERLKKACPLPISWAEQRALLLT
jgi:hypothetical protein